MLLSEQHVYLRQDKTIDFLNISLSPTDKTQELVKNEMTSNEEQKMFEAKGLSKSENDISKLKNKRHSYHLTKQRSSSHSHSYDADTDTDPEEDVTPIPSKVPNVLQCEICHLEYTSCHEDKFNMLYLSGEEPRTLSYIDAKKIKKLSRRKTNIERNTKSPERAVKINFEDYKDWSHRMEEFSADAERKWTLKYQFDEEEYQPKLTKIIIGRGQRDEYPELNNVLLFDEVKRFKKAPWRNDLVSQLKDSNEDHYRRFGLYPATNSCLFCFEERSKEITSLLRKGISLQPKAKTKPTGTELNNPILVKSAHTNGKLNHRSHVDTNLEDDVKKNKKKFKLKSLFKSMKLKTVEDHSLPDNDENNDGDDDDDEDFTMI